MRKNLLRAVLALLIAGSLAACANTVRGAGKDIENAGQSVQDAVPPKR